MSGDEIEETERTAPLTLFCIGCHEPITLAPIAMPEKFVKLLPSLMSMLGAPIAKDTDEGEPTLFGMNGRDLSIMLAPMCYGCSSADPKRKAEISLRPYLRLAAAVRNGD